MQSVLSSVGSPSTVLTLIQEAKAQSEVSETGQAGARERRPRACALRLGPPESPESPGTHRRSVREALQRGLTAVSLRGSLLELGRPSGIQAQLLV